MIPSIDTYLKKEIEPLLNIMLSQCYIIDEVLKDFDTDVVTTFKKAYCGDNPKHEITVGYTYPDVKSPLLAHYIIQLGDGSEIKKSLGGVEGTFTFKETSQIEETTAWVHKGDKLIATVSETIGEFISNRDMIFSDSDNLIIEDNMFIINSEGNEWLSDMKTQFIYQGKECPVNDKDPHGSIRGFTSQDSVMITAISTNVDTVRCLDAILKTILIMLRHNVEEQNYYALQQMNYSSLGPVFEDGDTIVLGRSTTLRYTVSYNVEFTVLQNINKLIVRGK